MRVVHWKMLPEEELAKADKPKVAAAFHRLVYAVSGKARVTMLDRDAELELIGAWLDHQDKSALDKLLKCFDPLIMTMARNVTQSHGVPHHAGDAYQVGQEAFIRSLPRFERDSGNRLSSFIRYSVAGEMMRHCLDVILPMRTGAGVGERRAYYQHRAAIDAFVSEHGRRPVDSREDLATMAASLGCSPKAMARARQTRTAKVIPLHHLDLWTEDPGYDDIEAVRRILVEEFRNLDQVMTERDAKIARSFALRHGQCGAAEDIGKQHGLTSERIRQISREAMRHIRESLARRGLTSLDAVMTAG